MTLIDRYVHEVGRRLPRKNRADIQAELRSLLVDALEDRAGPDPTEAEITELLKEHGPPKEVAASYDPEGQYLIGPALYPLFKLVTGITLAAVLGAQLLAWGLALLAGQGSFAPLQALEWLLSGVPAAFGTIVIVFAILQRFEVRPDTTDEEWDPKSLPKIDETEAVGRGERIFGIVMGIAILVLLLFFPQWIGFVKFPGGEFFANPVIPQYIGLISFSILAGIAMDIYLLWQGEWKIATRVAKVAVNLLSITVLLLLVQGHTAWLADHGAGWIDALRGLADIAEGSWQLIGMQAFRMAFVVAAVVVVFDTLIMIYRMVRGYILRGDTALKTPLPKV
jgi:hypothetical protein